MPSKIISILVLIIITLLVSGLMAFGYYSIIKTTRKLSSVGLLDDEFLGEDKKDAKKWVNITLNVISIGVATVLILLCGLGLTYHIMDQQFVLNDKTALVISSNSMEGFYSEEYENELVHNLMSYKNIDEKAAEEELKETQFYTGDLLGFSKIHDDESIALYEVYGYRNKSGQIITHRLVAIEGDKYIFRGDNTFANDAKVNRDQILYHYGTTRFAGVGIFVLFFSSSFGLYSIFITVLVMVMGDVFQHRYQQIRRERLNVIAGSGKHAYQ